MALLTGARTVQSAAGREVGLRDQETPLGQQSYPPLFRAFRGRSTGLRWSGVESPIRCDFIVKESDVSPPFET